MIWLANTVVAQAARVVDHRRDVAHGGDRFPFDTVGLAALAAAALFGAITLCAAIGLW